MLSREFRLMRKKIVKILILSILFSTACFAKEPKNLTFVKEDLIRYHDSGEYAKDQTKVIDHAMLYLKLRLAKAKKSPSEKKLAIVLDIDETSLSNYSDMLTLNFGGALKSIMDEMNKGTDAAIPATLELYRYAKANNVAVFFISGRPESFRASTVRNLENVGYKNWDGIILLPETYHEKSNTPFKISAREQLEKQDYDIVLNIGDQKSDLVGGHADKTFKLPNPYYFLK